MGVDIVPNAGAAASSARPAVAISLFMSFIFKVSFFIFDHY
jgi:hypothetical protein